LEIAPRPLVAYGGLRRATMARHEPDGPPSLPHSIERVRWVERVAVIPNV
jgi:hypothetical protein